MILTRRELIEKLSVFPDDTVILIDSSDGEYYPRPISGIFQVEDSKGYTCKRKQVHQARTGYICFIL